MTSEVWEARYPDLTGKVALVAGDHDGLVEVVRLLAANGSPVGVIASDRATVDAALAVSADNPSMGVVSDPAEPATWARVIPHAEQRLGPLDIVVALGAAPARRAVIDAVVPDMTARRRGVIVEVGEESVPDDPAAGVRRRYVVVDGAARADAVAAVVALCASDVLASAAATITLAD